ncbi:hypothetical protein CHS0354_024375 [Potamilus streckersoni]|uniref:Schlafen AlbA-2 domain-containing protein n=1 Tax=Potamilus streckersoni TaxID=2493646 RepID=A0AAE0SEI2_9BIVA|nr:hypothetical protein CHS0354_024375 [Potamilus streckersoni]
MVDNQQASVYVGNLRSDVRIGELKNYILILFNEALYVRIQKNDINIITSKKRYAIVDVHNEKNVDFVLQKISTFESRKKMRFNFLCIVPAGKMLHVDRVRGFDKEQSMEEFDGPGGRKRHRKGRKNKIYPKLQNESFSKEEISSRGTGSLVGSTLGQGHPRPFESTPNTEDQYDEETEDEGDNTQTDNVFDENRPVSEIDLRSEQYLSQLGQDADQSRRSLSRSTGTVEHTPAKKDHADFLQFLEHTLSSPPPVHGTHESSKEIKTSINQRRIAESRSQTSKFYEIGEKLGNETRNREFKTAGGQYLVKQIQNDVPKYICGFLNSGERGTLMMGIQDDGTVIGVECDQAQEDRYRRHIDTSIKEIEPPLFPTDYKVDFIQVVEHSGNTRVNCKVIEITVEEQSIKDKLFETKQGVFVRRDGSLQGPIKASHIQEWTRKKHIDEINRLQKKETELQMELQQKDRTIRTQADTIRQQQDEIKRYRTAQPPPSKTCVIL